MNVSRIIRLGQLTAYPAAPGGGGLSIGVAAKGSGNPAAVSNGVTTTSGSTLVAYIYGNGAFVSIIDSNLNGWTQVSVERTVYGGGQIGRMYYAQNITGGASHTVTATVTAADVSVVWVEILGASAASLDSGSVASLADDAGSQPYDSLTSGVLSQAVEMAIYAFGDGASGTISHAEGTTFTKITNSEVTAGATAWTACLFYKLTAATTALTPSGSTTGTGNGTEANCFIAAFK